MRRESDGGTGEGEDRGSAHLRELQRHRRSRLGKLLVVLFILIVLTLFIIQNYKPTPEIHYVFFTHHSHLLWVMLSCAILGGIIGFLVGRPGKAFRFHDDEHGD